MVPSWSVLWIAIPALSIALMIEEDGRFFSFPTEMITVSGFVPERNSLAAAPLIRDERVFPPGFLEISGDSIVDIIENGVNEEVFTIVLNKGGITVADVYEVDSKISEGEGWEEKDGDDD